MHTTLYAIRIDYPSANHHAYLDTWGDPTCGSIDDRGVQLFVTYAEALAAVDRLRTGLAARAVVVRREGSSR